MAAARGFIPLIILPDSRDELGLAGRVSPDPRRVFFSGGDSCDNYHLMPERKEPTKPKKGCLYFFGPVFLLAVAAGLAIAVYFICIPQDLSTVEDGEKVASGRDLGLVFEKALGKGHTLTIREGELNHWISSTLECNQGGLGTDWVEIEGVSVRMEDGFIELIQKREIFGKSFTVSMFIRLEETEDDGKQVKKVHLNSGPLLEGSPYPRRGGRFGSLYVPEGFLLFVLPSYKQLAALYEKEIELAIEEMESVRFEKGRVILKPWKVQQVKRPGSR